MYSLYSRTTKAYNMVKMVIHMADIHIRNTSRHEEYAEAFEKLMASIESKTEGLGYDEVRIVIAGDTVHQKNVVTNELYTLVPRFIRELEKLAPVVVIAGNHDLSEYNKEKQDTISGIFEAAEFEHTTFLDAALGYESGCVHDDNITWAVYSIYDKGRRPEIDSDGGNVVVGLYHGMVSGCVLDNGSKSEDGAPIGMFEGCDCVMAGDIHKRQVMEVDGVKLVYPGSLIQQTYGESVSGHGYCLWRVEGKELLNEFVNIDSDYGMYKFKIKSESDVDNDEEFLVNQ